MDDFERELRMESENCTPPELREIANSSLDNLLPKKSKKVYEKKYQIFKNWCSEKNVQVISENVLIAYFDGESKVKKASTLWSLYSKLKACINIYENRDISQYMKLQALLKRCSEGYEPKKSQILEFEHINKFITDADNNTYLSLKVALIMGYSGACRREELVNMTIHDLQFKDDSVFVTIPKTKNGVPRLFIVTEPLWVLLIKQYIGARPKNTTHTRLFLTYRNGYCVNSPIGINKMGAIPKIIATFLNMPNPHTYTGHCFRRSSISHLANKGSDLITIKRHGGWKSSSVAEGYIQTSVKRKTEVAQMLCGASSTSVPKVVSSTSSTSALENLTFKPTSFEHQVTPGSTGTLYTSQQRQQVQHTQNIIVNRQRSEQNILTQVPELKVSAHETSTVTINVYNNCTIQQK